MVDDYGYNYEAVKRPATVNGALVMMKTEQNHQILVSVIEDSCSWNKN